MGSAVRCQWLPAESSNGPTSTPARAWAADCATLPIVSTSALRHTFEPAVSRCSNRGTPWSRAVAITRRPRRPDVRSSRRTPHRCGRPGRSRPTQHHRRRRRHRIRLGHQARVGRLPPRGERRQADHGSRRLRRRRRSPTWPRITDEGDRRDGPSRFMQALRFAAREAITDATERGWEPGKVVGVVHSLVLGDVEMWSDFYREAPERVRARRWVNMMPSTVISHADEGERLPRPGDVGVGHVRLRQRGTDHRQVVDRLGHRHRRHPAGHRPVRHPAEPARVQDVGVAVLDTPPLEACRPFQEGSRGFVGGEAAVAMVLSGRGRRLPGHHPRRSHVDGRLQRRRHGPRLDEVFRCFREAVDNSGVDASEIAYVNAHGPGTAQCDAAEGTMLDELFPDAHGIFSVKPLTGPLPGRGAAVEDPRHHLRIPDGLHPGPAARWPTGTPGWSTVSRRGCPVRWSSPPSAWVASIPPW